MENLEISFEEEDIADLTTVISEFPLADDNPGQNIPVKKLSDTFDGCVKTETHMKVFLRIRPIASNGKCTESTIRIENDFSIVTNAPETSKRAQYTKTEERHYVFNRVFGPLCLQSDIFEQAIGPLADRFLNGENCILLAYGMTNAGKTYTIQGSNQHSPGILPRLVNSVLETIALEPSITSTLEISMLEIYQEKLLDLLSDNKDKLFIRDANGKTDVSKLSVHPIANSQEAFRFLDLATTKRSKSNTFLNSGSSRSHAIYSLILKRTISGRETSAVFQVVDLAGAERCNRTRATAAQQKEANNINVSLMQLWRCLQGLKKKGSDGNNTSSMLDQIPYRESKLTHLLMPQLGRAGLQGAAMITCINPQIEDYDETISILSNASLACKINVINEIKYEPPKPELKRAISKDLSLAKEINTKTEKATKDRNANIHANANVHGNAVLSKRKRGSAVVTSVKDVPQVVIAEVPVPVTAESKVQQTQPCEDSTISKQEAVAAPQLAPVVAMELESVVQASQDDDESGSELKRLRIEVVRLETENNQLVKYQLQRETEIREEICEEMTMRSAHLLQQIHDLQEQLSKNNSAYGNGSSGGKGGDRELTVMRSVKKARRKQIDTANDEAVKNLHEVEDELERFRNKYDNDTCELKSQNKKLEYDLRSVKGQMNSIKEAVAPAVHAHASTGPVVSFEIQNEVIKRFSPNRSPRSPLAIIKVDENSPVQKVVQVQEQQHMVHVASCGSTTACGIDEVATAVMSKKRSSKEVERKRTAAAANKMDPSTCIMGDVVADNNSSATSRKINSVEPTTYFKKLRSHLLRG